MKVILKKGKEKSILRKHPWVFSGAIATVEGKPISGQSIEVVDANGRFLGIGQFSPHSQIRVRMLTFDKAIIDRKFFENRINESILRRKIDHANEASRLIYSESDLLPGLIVDSYAGHFVVQYLSAGMEFWKDTVNEILLSHPLCQTLYERSDSGSRSKEGLGKRSGTIGTKNPPELINVVEGNYEYLVDIRRGHKTGFYLDQRTNRQKISLYGLQKEALNCFSYTGVFSLGLMKNGARSVINVDASEDALNLLEKNFKLNKMDLRGVENICADVFDLLRKFKEEKRQFDLIILDPPKFAESAQQVIKAARGYKDINRLAFEILRPGGILATFSCSGHISADLFQKIVADAALDAGKQSQILEFLGQSPDHPVLLSFPEAEYLKGMICRII